MYLYLPPYIIIIIIIIYANKLISRVVWLFI